MRSPHPAGRAPFARPPGRRDAVRGAWHAFDALHNRFEKRYVWLMKTPSRSVKKTPKSFADLPPIRVRREPPTIVEAVAAAQDLADDVEQQVEIAAGLIGLPADEIRPHVLAAKLVKPQRAPERIMTHGSPSRAPRTVVVERRTRPTVVIERRTRPMDPRR